MDRLPKKNTENVRTELKDLFGIYDIEAARVIKMKILNKFEEKYPSMCGSLDSGFEDAFQFTPTASNRYNRLKNTNLLVRLNQEIRRRERVIRILPNV